MCGTDHRVAGDGREPADALSQGCARDVAAPDGSGSRAERMRNRFARQSRPARDRALRALDRRAPAEGRPLGRQPMELLTQSRGRALALVVALLCAPWAASGAERPLTLDDAVRLAL